MNKTKLEEFYKSVEAVFWFVEVVIGNGLQKSEKVKFVRYSRLKDMVENMKKTELDELYKSVEAVFWLVEVVIGNGLQK